MARTFVYSDNLTARVELVTDPGDALVHTFCAGCAAEIFDHGFDTLDDAEQAAGPHVDRCTACADPACIVSTRHDAGHRCRKV